MDIPTQMRCGVLKMEQMHLLMTTHNGPILMLTDLVTITQIKAGMTEIQIGQVPTLQTLTIRMHVQHEKEPHGWTILQDALTQMEMDGTTSRTPSQLTIPNGVMKMGTDTVITNLEQHRMRVFNDLVVHSQTVLDAATTMKMESRTPTLRLITSFLMVLTHFSMNPLNGLIVILTDTVTILSASNPTLAPNFAIHPL